MRPASRRTLQRQLNRAGDLISDKVEGHLSTTRKEHIGHRDVAMDTAYNNKLLSNRRPG